MAGVSVTHNSDISCDDIAKLVMDYHYPNVWALYAKRWTPKDGLDAAKDMITELQVALAAKEEEAAKNAAELEEQRAEAEKLAAELVEQRAEAEKLAAELVEQRAEAEKLAAELVEQRAEAEKLAAELVEQRAEAEKLAAELEEQRAEAEKLAAELVEQRAEAEKLAAELEEKSAEAEKLAAEVVEQRAEAEKLAAEVVEQRAEAEKLAAELVEQRAEAEKLGAELEEQRAEAEKLAAELEEKSAEAEKLAAEVVEQRAEAEKLAAEVVEKRAEAEKLAAELVEQRAEAGKLAAELEEQRAEAEKLAAELVEQRAEAEKLAAEVAAFRAKRNAALEARDADGTLPVLEKAVAADEAAAQALDPRQIADGPLYAVTLEELYVARDETDRILDADGELRGNLAEKVAECRELIAKIEDVEMCLCDARNEQCGMQAKMDELERSSAAALRDRDEERRKVATELMALREINEQLVTEARAFRKKRLSAFACREANGFALSERVGSSFDKEDANVPVPSVMIEREALLCVRMEELNEQRDLNTQLLRDMSALGERIRDAMDPESIANSDSDAVFSHLEALLKALEESRAAEQAARDLAEEREGELAQLQKLFQNEEERLNNDLGEAREEVERLQGELDLLTDQLDEACRLFGDADAVNAEGVAKLETFSEVLAAARGGEKDAIEQLEIKENELEDLRSALKDTRYREEMLENLEDEVAQLQREKEITETELGAVQKEMSDLRRDLRAAEDRAAEKSRDTERMKLDLDALNSRIQDLLEELEEKTDQYNQVIKDLDDFAKNQSRENEKELLQRLLAREQELFELQEARRGENDEHEKQVGVLQGQINRLRDQTHQDNALHDGLQDELARLHKLLADAEAALRDKVAENEALKDGIEGMIDEHEAQMREMEQELEGKSKEVSDALERLEEMSAMVQEARESEESALRLRADSDAEVFRLQRELDKIKQMQSVMTESSDDRGGLLAQIMDSEGQLRDAETAIRKKNAELEEAEKEWRKKLNRSENLNHDLRRLLKRTMAALSKSADTMGNSAGALDAFRDELKPMMQ
ncbi:hypothetical protein, unknown function [Leishmania braziliensis MHOM/BR/75/M2904]|uniref:FAZ1 C-terminal region domain-containing protein n=2 Tax=Leishmania braziliensis TaxID=5660 RepID=A4HAW8_LEIBR|nr:hypothetical protein, unknown function [Leishmania braziliensis MHOM/BR/75/M2904]CAM38553.1 hypothetical protein, unknown function [Leishmania braziliensis MHOM/BR/75/M2904]